MQHSSIASYENKYHTIDLIKFTLEKILTTLNKYWGLNIFESVISYFAGTK